MVVPIVDWYSYCCTRSRSTSGTVTAVPEVDRVLVQLKAVPKVDRLLVQLNAVPEVDRVLVQVIAVPEVDRLLVQHSCTDRRLVRIDFWYTTYISPKSSVIQSFIYFPQIQHNSIIYKSPNPAVLGHSYIPQILRYSIIYISPKSCIILSFIYTPSELFPHFFYTPILRVVAQISRVV